MKVLLKVENLIKKFGSFTAVNNISFYLKEEILGLLGSNGAGKTTTIQMLLSTMTPTSGKIIYFGKNFFTHRSEILEKVSFASTYVKLPGQLTIEENLTIYGELYGVSKNDRKKRIEKFLKFFGMWDKRNRNVGVLSAGELSRVMLAKAFISYPSIVLLDEPTAALDPDIAIEVRSFIKEQQQEYGVAILLTSHNMFEVTNVCHRVLVMQQGTIIANNTPKELALSVKSVHLQLLITHNFDHLVSFLKEKNILYTLENRFINIEIDEHDIASFLAKLAELGIMYDQISIEKPTLEDYFINLAKKARST